IVEQRLKSRLLLLLAILAEGLVVDREQTSHVTVAGFNNFLGRGEVRADFVQLVAHGMAGVAQVLSGQGFSGEGSLHQRLGLRGRESERACLTLQLKTARQGEPGREPGCEMERGTDDRQE